MMHSKNIKLVSKSKAVTDQRTRKEYSAYTVLFKFHIHLRLGMVKTPYARMHAHIHKHRGKGGQMVN